MEYTDLIIEKKYPIGYITINRPEKRNALTTQPGGTVEQLARAYTDMADDPEIRVFILKGAGDCFCAGFDMGTYDQGYWRERPGWGKGKENEVWAAVTMETAENPESRFFQPMWWNELWNNPKPSIALVHSFCLGAGLANANLCDIVLATPESVFAYPPVRYGASIWPGALQPWLLGLRMCMELALTGRFLDAQEAYNCGLINRIVPEDKLLEEGQRLAESIAKVPPMTNLFSKMTVHQYYDKLGIREWYDYGQLTCLVTEQSSLPGHYWDFFDIVRDKGFTEAYKIQREKWGYPDPVLDKEVARLKARKSKS